MATQSPSVRRAIRMEARLLAIYTDSTRRRLARGEITKDQAARLIEDHIWSYKVGCAVARSCY